MLGLFNEVLKELTDKNDSVNDVDIDTEKEDTTIKLFDYTVSNPPYQIDSSKGKKSTGTRTSIDIFPDFHKYAVKYSDQVVMIYPATWQKNINKGHGKWLIDNGLKSASNYIAKDVFGNSIEASIMLSVLHTVTGYFGDISINGSLRSRNIPVWISNDTDNLFYERTRGWNKGYLSGASYMTKLSNIKDSKIMILPENISDDTAVDIYIKRNPGKQADADFFKIKEKDIKEYIIPQNDHYDFNKYNVVIQSAVFGRQSVFDRMIRQIGTIQARVFEKKTTSGLTLASLKSFNTKEEATNFANYMNSKIVSSLLYFDYSKKTFGSFVPDLKDYTDNNPDIDWSKPLDPQLYELFGLTDDEIKSIN